MKLYIAEKPSVANDIAKALGGNVQKKNGYIEAGEDLVTWCYGHLLKSVEPEDYNPNYKKWVASDLPLQLYYTLAGDFSVNGQQFAANWKVNEDAPQDDKKRLTSKGYADTLAQRLKGKCMEICQMMKRIFNERK